jgi:histidine phosphotransferase ChpT
MPVAPQEKGACGDMTEALRLAELLCARLCHDLSGPVGALIGILEIAHEELPDSETVALAEETAVELAQRLKLLRAAWGCEGEDLDLIRLQSFATSLSASRRLRLDLAGLEPGLVFAPPLARLVLNILLLAADSLPGGGVVSLSGASPDHLLISIAGPRAAWPAGLGASLADTTSAWEAALGSVRGLQGPLTALLAEDLGYRLSILMPVGATGDGEAAPPILLSRTI